MEGVAAWAISASALVKGFSASQASRSSYGIQTSIRSLYLPLASACGAERRA
jgi:hypothetical protein